jgi:hypothetical protein
MAAGMTGMKAPCHSKGKSSAQSAWAHGAKRLTWRDTKHTWAAQRPKTNIKFSFNRSGVMQRCA